MTDEEKCIYDCDCKNWMEKSRQTIVMKEIREIN